ncbi:potassium transporter Kup [Rhizorhapis suberifaciens]|uniref:Probable potassium transport system protein Kup n=1 Tax=Rhizorhapis suberifaciens TaxID=13656 RepID=A0A840HWR6_9SPHN|nr:potassium transporter Kup [Rhizorhapis suberifaciens]MBB4642515.1 KUP system potassium uptake protein [Rhizorhapis suberifaciens]
MTTASATNPKRTFALTIGAIGVVYGDIGTSPLYAFREALAQAAGNGIARSEILGVLSLAVWALILIVTVKYVLFLTRADNNGEGGVLSLMALAMRGTRRPSLAVIILGAAGAALFYGDAIITPALSVLSAVEGLTTVPGVDHMMTPHIILGLTMGILTGLFFIQSHGTARVASLFGPICVIWFLALGGLGIWHIAQVPQILLSLNPIYAVSFVSQHGVTGLFVLGAVFLTVTGAEALIADMGHFGRKPIQMGWLYFVFPALTLNYLGQGALALSALAAAKQSGTVFHNADWFFLMAPDALRAPLVILATLATIIASQAVITGAFSLTQQAIALGLLPRMSILQTSEHHAGQIYMPVINWLLFVGVVVLVNGFGSSSAMAAAYGIAVTGTMVVTTCLAFIVIHQLWRWRLSMAIAFIAPLLTIDLIFFGANILRVIEGGWVPLLVAALVGTVIATWVRGRQLVAQRTRGDTVPLDELASALIARPPLLVDGTAVFLTSDQDIAPTALLHNLKHNRVLHSHNLILSVRTINEPRANRTKRLTITRINSHFSRGTLTYGYMEAPDIPADLAREAGLVEGRGGTSFFIGRNALRRASRSGMPFLQDLLFIFLQRNAADPTAFFRIPPNRVVELGAQIEV